MKKQWFVLGVAGLIGGLVAGKRPLLGRLMDLPPVTYRVRVHRNLSITMPDGIELAADHYQPQSKSALPAILMRTPYGKGNINGFLAQRFAERGYHVLVQDVRGRFRSDGEFEPYVNEQADGVATLDWLAAQPWCDGQVGMWGQSYVGYVQWAAAAVNPPVLRAIVPAITQANLAIGRADNVMLDRTLRWLIMLDAMDTNVAGLPWWQLLPRTFDMRVQDELVAKAAAHLPLQELDTVVFGQPFPVFRNWRAHPDIHTPYWQDIDFRAAVSTVQAPAHFIAGWYDIFLGGQLADYAALAASHAAGNAPQPFLTIGPWTHMDRTNMITTLREGLAWFDAHLKGKRHALARPPVRVFVMGAEVWREYASWPPPATETAYYLEGNGRLSHELPAADTAPDTYLYDPADPTPNVGGALLSPHAGARDNRDLEARADVLTFTTPPLTEALEIVGPVRAVLFVQSSQAYTDFFARLCVVQEDGRSINLCDGITRVMPGVGEPQADGSLRLEIDLWATAYHFEAGQRLRLQLSSGAHPRFARNLGTDESAWTGTEMAAAQQTIYHDAARPSHLLLPLL
ncbi:MAG: CocE/NonD family hydrolase [Chloroflexota bacterium]